MDGSGNAFRVIFKSIDPDDPEREITQKDQFNSDEVTLAETLVREALQNSNDARKASKVFVRFGLRKPDPRFAPFWSSLFASLEPHLSASRMDLQEVDLAMPKILTIEDFGTTGLTGRWDSKDDSNFQDFWRRIGRSHKSREKAGSWGLGKLVFPSLSRVRTFFGLTIQHDDPDRLPLLMGQTVLRYHDLDDKRYDPLGLFAITKGPKESSFRVPATDPMVIRTFSEAVGFTREREAGLSIAVPFVANDFELEALIQYTVRNYFFPILTGQLAVQVGEVLIDDSTFDELSTQYGGDALADQSLTQFIRRVHSATSEERAGYRLPSDWTKGAMETSFGEELEKLQNQYAEGRLIHVRAPIRLTPREGAPQDGCFELFLQQADANSAGKALFVRGSLTVPGEAQYFPSRRAYAALVARDGVVGHFLRDAENPAHTRWNGQAEKLNEAWKSGASKLSQIRKSLRTLHEVLAGVSERLEENALRDVLAIKKTGASGVARREPIVKPTVPAFISRPKTFNVGKLSNGFLIRGSGSLAQDSLPIQLKVRAGYDVARGDPFKRHSPFDFNFRDVRPINVAASGAEVEMLSANELLVAITDPSFEIRVTGFDVNRDLKVKVIKQ